MHEAPVASHWLWKLCVNWKKSENRERATLILISGIQSTQIATDAGASEGCSNA